MCMSAIAWSGFGRVIYGTSIPYIERHGGSQIDIRAREVVQKSHKQIQLVEGFLHNETDLLYAEGTVDHLHNHSYSHQHLYEGRDFHECLIVGGTCPKQVGAEQALGSRTLV